MKTKLTILSIVLFASQASYAGSETYLQEGTQEIGISGSLDLDAPDDYNFEFDGSYGYFIKDNWEVGAEISTTMTDHTGSYGLGAFTEYNFTNKSDWVPYLGAAVEYSAFDQSLDDGYDDDQDGTSFQAYGGIKYFINPTVAISAEANYSVASDDVYWSEDGVSDDKVQFLLGTRFYY